jgi:hypothetical protein
MKGLFGDPRQLPPTVMLDGVNEGAEFLKRSLLSRLMETDYPQMSLNINYRNHPQILGLLNKAIYGGKLIPGRSTNQLERVGRTWNAWTRRTMPEIDLGSRRLFLSVDTVSSRQENEASWSNLGQIQAVQGLLQDMYDSRTPQGEQIRPSDVMIIRPYKAQRSLVAATLAETEHGCLYRDNLTVDAAQGQEAPVVVVLLTKLSEVAEEASFVANKVRLNVALSRAQKAIIIVGNARLWPEPVIKNIERRSSHKFFTGVLGCVLRLITAKSNRQVQYSQLLAAPVTSVNAIPISDPMDVDNTSESVARDPATGTFAQSMAPTPMDPLQGSRVRRPPSISRSRSGSPLTRESEFVLGLLLGRSTREFASRPG